MMLFGGVKGAERNDLGYDRLINRLCSSERDAKCTRRFLLSVRYKNIANDIEFRNPDP